MALRIVPVKHADANEFVRRFHRHHKPTPGAIFCVACADDEGVRGVAIVGRPVARALDDGQTLEINRVCTDGARNACSLLLGAVRRVGKALGYRRVITYTLPEEGGASLRAAGFVCEGEFGGGAWDKSRPRAHMPDDLIGQKLRWSAW